MRYKTVMRLYRWKFRYITRKIYLSEITCDKVITMHTQVDFYFNISIYIKNMRTAFHHQCSFNLSTIKKDI